MRSIVSRICFSALDIYHVFESEPQRKASRAFGVANTHIRMTSKSVGSSNTASETASWAVRSTNTIAKMAHGTIKTVKDAVRKAFTANISIRMTSKAVGSSNTTSEVAIGLQLAEFLYSSPRPLSLCAQA